MTPKEKKIDDWALKAYNAITNPIDRENCDNETGRECVGVRCKIGPHRAAVYLMRIMDEVAR